MVLLEQKTNTIRWFVLIIVICNILFNYFYQHLLPNTASIADISGKYNTLFAPAGYVFSIWAVIYASFIVYAIIQLTPSQRRAPVYDSLASPMIAINLLSIMWIVAFTYEYIIPGVFIIVCMLITGAMLFSLVSINGAHYSAWLKFPFRVFLGWISVATISNIALCMEYLNWSGIGIDPTHWTMIMIIVACLLALGVSYRFKDLVYPAVICWACIGIGVKNFPINYEVAITAFVISGTILVWIIISLIIYYVSHKNSLPDNEGENPQTPA
jgi:benzodiazapine receptor